MKRKVVQWLAAIAANGNIAGFAQGQIYKGLPKSLCVPGLNCYSCPGALGACPIGALQAVAGSVKYSVSFYVIGLLMGFGLIFGRFICGFLCPFGLIQELFYKIPVPKTKKTRRWPRYIKFVVLAVFVIGMPLFLTNSAGMSSPAFCAFICPAGTLTAALPLLLFNEPLRSVIGSLFFVKLTILALVVTGSSVVYRFFCRYLCPLGAVYALFNKISLYQLKLDVIKCTHCGACAAACKMGIDPSKEQQSMECIRCGSCVTACPSRALSAGFRKKHFERGADSSFICKRGVK